jgi:hypothetical protein
VDVDEAEVIFAAFDAAEIGAVEAGGEGDILLGHLARLAELAEAGAEALLDPLLRCLVHPQLVGSLWTISLWKMIHIRSPLWQPLFADPVAPGGFQRGFDKTDVEVVQAVKLSAEDEQVGTPLVRSQVQPVFEQPDRGFEDQQLRRRFHAAPCLAQLCGL